MAAYFLGIDGGGTSCRAALSDDSGKLLGYGTSGAANILTDPDVTLKHIVEAASLAFESAGLEPHLSSSYVVMGLAGTNVGSAVSYIEGRLPFKQSDVVHDGLIALQGALGDGDGAIGILGTGSAFVLRSKGKIQTIGGWGFKGGDFGSGACMGQALVREALLAADQIVAKTPVITELLGRFSNRADELANFAAQAKPSDFGSLAPLLFDYAQQNDECALRLIEDAASTVDLALDEILRRLGGRGSISLIGGVAPYLQAYLAKRHHMFFVAAKEDPVMGALALAKRMPVSSERAVT